MNNLNIKDFHLYSKSNNYINTNNGHFLSQSKELNNYPNNIQSSGSETYFSS